MQRDMDLIREILIKVELLQLRPGEKRAIGVLELNAAPEDYNAVFDNLRLAVDGGLIDTTSDFGMDGRIGVRGLSFAGADFLDKVREPENWSATKSIAAKVGSFSMDVLKAAASSVVETKLKSLIGG